MCVHHKANNNNSLGPKRHCCLAPRSADICCARIDEFSYRAWHFITSFIDYAIQMYVGQKARENQWRVMVIEEFLHTALLYHASNTRNINAVAVLEQYLVLVEKE